VDSYINLNAEKPIKNNPIPTPDKIRSHIPTLLLSKTLQHEFLQPPRVCPPRVQNDANVTNSDIPQRVRKSARLQNQSSALLSLIIDNLNRKFKKIPQTPKNLALNSIFTDDTHQQAYHTFLHPKILHIYDKSGRRQTMQKLIKSEERERWLRALSNEWGRLAQDNIFVCDHRPLKEKKLRVRCVSGGDKLKYPGDPLSASLLNT